MSVILADGPCSAAGTFTTNRIVAAPVVWDRALVPSEDIRAIVVNAGNANAATGSEGFANAQRTAELAADRLACKPEQILLASTGIIGQQLPMASIERGLPEAIAEATDQPAGFQAASEAILTTDTRPKVVSKRQKLEDGREIRLLGLAKGAAMIGPNMATMLAFLLTDARIPPGTLQGMLIQSVEESFNCISVEGHTSTNDSVLMLSAGKGQPALEGAELRDFAGLVRQTCQELARMIPDDGEGASHLITIDVQGCRDRDQAHKIAKTVADSALVKTAIHGADPNWGRIVSAAGYAGVPFEEAELSLWLDEVPLYQNGTPVPYDAQALSARMQSEREVHLRLSIQQGEAAIRFWTCDLTAEYIRINAEYTT